MDMDMGIGLFNCRRPGKTLGRARVFDHRERLRDRHTLKKDNIISC